MANTTTDTEKYRSTFVAASVNSMDSDVFSGRGSSESSSGGSASSGKFFRVRQLDSSTGSKDGGHLLDCRLGTDQQTGQQQVEMIFSLTPPGNGNLLEIDGTNFSRANVTPPEPILYKAGDTSFSNGDVTADESPAVFVGQQPLLTKVTNASRTYQEEGNPNYNQQANVSPSETFSISRFRNTDAMKERLQKLKPLLIGVSEALKLDQDNRAYYFIYLCLLLLFVLHYTFSWMTDFSTVTSLSLFLICLTVLDFYSEFICTQLDKLNIRQKGAKWDNKDEERYAAICLNLGHIENRLRSIVRDLNALRRAKSKLAYMNAALILLFLAWIGSVLGGILILYLLCAAAVGVVQFDLRQKSHLS